MTAKMAIHQSQDEERRRKDSNKKYGEKMVSKSGVFILVTENSNGARIYSQTPCAR